MKRKEILIVILIVLVAGTFYLLDFIKKQNSDYIVIKNLKKDEIILRVPLSEDGFYTVQGEYGKFNINISDGKVKAVEVECPNKVCETMGPITKGYIGVNNIICIPNALEVYLEEK